MISPRPGCGAQSRRSDRLRGQDWRGRQPRRLGGGLRRSAQRLVQCL